MFDGVPSQVCVSTKLLINPLTRGRHNRDQRIQDKRPNPPTLGAIDPIDRTIARITKLSNVAMEFARDR